MSYTRMLAAIAAACGMIAAAPAQATTVDGTFSGVLTSGFSSNGYNSAAGDNVSGIFSFDTSNPNAFTATLYDATSGSSSNFTGDAGTTVTSDTGTQTYTIDANGEGYFPPTYTPYDADLILTFASPLSALTGDPAQVVEFVSGSGALDLVINRGTDPTLYPTIAFAITSASVPEPASVALIGCGLIGLATLRRRRA